MLGQYAQVDMVSGVAETVAAMMGSLSGAPIEGPGLTQDDVTQLVARWAWRRDRIMRGAADNVKVALYSEQPHLGAGAEQIAETTYAFRGVWEGSTKDLNTKMGKDPTLRAHLIVGDGPIVSPYPGGKGLPDNWAALLGRALDNTTELINKAKKGGTVPAGYASFTQTVVAPLIVGIIVGGVAVTVIGTAAVWRYFDPDVRKQVAMLHAASAAFDARVQVAKQTGTLPPPSEIELGAKELVGNAAGEETKRSLLIAGGIAGGLTLGAIGLAWIRSR